MRKLLFLFILFLSLKTSAQNTENTKPVSNEPKVEMADTFRENGKIYIVVAVVLIVLLGIFLYLFMLEKKLANIEKELKKNISEKSV
jgi:CcmD family protein